MSLNKEKPGPFVWFSTLQCGRFGRESVKSPLGLLLNFHPFVSVTCCALVSYLLTCCCPLFVRFVALALLFVRPPVRQVSHICPSLSPSDRRQAFPGGSVLARHRVAQDAPEGAETRGYQPTGQHRPSTRSPRGRPLFVTKVTRSITTEYMHIRCVSFHRTHFLS